MTGSAMKIAYYGSFLGEGLRELGHTLLDLKPDQEITAQLAEQDEQIDLIILELFGGFAPVKALCKCDIPTVAYCVDTPLNEFWLREIAPVFDYVFVDQLQSASALAKYGIKAAWLPLPAQNWYFQPKTKKKYDVTFIGTVIKFRPKRKNLLNLIGQTCDINIMSGVAPQQLPKIFAESKIVLNENLFPGLTLRTIQGLAAGSVVFSEKSLYGHAFDLNHKKDIFFYDSSSIVPDLVNAIHNYECFLEVGKNAQAKCRLNFSSAKVAEKMLDFIGKHGSAKTSPSQRAFLWQKTCADFLFVQRFGGNLSDIYHKFTYFTNIQHNTAAAHMALGNIKAWSRKIAEAERRYFTAGHSYHLPEAYLKLALLKIARDDAKSALNYITEYNRLCAENQEPEKLLTANGTDASALLNFIAEAYYRQGKLWEMGFQKSHLDIVPETGFETAMLSWQKRPNATAVEIMLKCLAPFQMQGELLPILLDAIKAGLLSDSLILTTANLAHSYYDHATAAVILAAMKKAK